MPIVLVVIILLKTKLQLNNMQRDVWKKNELESATAQTSLQNNNWRQK